MRITLFLVLLITFKVSKVLLDRNFPFNDAVDNVKDVFLREHNSLDIIHDMSLEAREIISNILIQNSDRFSAHVEDIENLISAKAVGRKRLLVFIIFDSVESFRRLNKTLNTKNFRRNGFTLMLLLNGAANQIGEIFDYFWNKNLYNVNVVVRNNMSSLTALTFMPFTDKKCGDTSVKVINEFDVQSGKWITPFNFPHKFKNLKGCKIVHAATEAAVVKESSGDSRGIEIDIINVIGNILNYKAKHIVSKGKGSVSVNGSGSGILKDIFDRKIDVTTGSLQLKRTLVFSESYPFTSDPLVLIIPPGVPFTPFEKLINAFSYEVWAAMFLVLLIAVLMLKLIPKQLQTILTNGEAKNSFLDLYNVFLGGSLNTNRLPSQGLLRYSLSIFMLYTLVLRTAYVGKLFLYLSSDIRHKEVSSVDDMMERNFTLYAYDSMIDRITDFRFFSRFVHTML